MRAILGIVIGLIAGAIAAIIVGIVAVGATFSLPPGTDPGNMDMLVRTMMAMPQATRIALAFAWFAGGFGGAAVAKLIARRTWAAWVVALIVAAYFGLNGLALTLPLWGTLLWIAAPLLGGLLANRLVGGAPAVVTTEAEAPPANP